MPDKSRGPTGFVVGANSILLFALFVFPDEQRLVAAVHNIASGSDATANSTVALVPPICL